ncbi:MAG: hypothetical protein JWO02_1389 [Solirubrobacterales bacterium]|nr:hypothetical protein [Solirubrobacterales bacterium]
MPAVVAAQVGNPDVGGKNVALASAIATVTSGDSVSIATPTGTARLSVPTAPNSMTTK